MGVSFKRARKAESKLRMALAGPSGSGKTYSALAIATALAGADGQVAVIDTERGSASKYSDVFAFDVLEMESFHPDRYIEAIQAAEAAGYRVLVIDSITHEWRGKDGILEQVDRIAKLNKMPSIQVWAQATPMHNRFVDAMLAASLHVIVTMRSKTGTHIDKDERGKVTVQKVGMEAEQRDGIEYEFDVVGDLDRDNTLLISKSRCSALAGQMIRKPGADVAEVLAEWLHGDDAETPEKPSASDFPAPATQKPTPAAASASAGAGDETATTQDGALPKWGELGQAAHDLGVDEREWQKSITQLTGKARKTDPKTGTVTTISAQLTDDDKRTMMVWLEKRRQQFAEADERTPPLASLAMAGAN